MKADLSELEASVGHSFVDGQLLACALTHRSLANELANELATVRGQEAAAETGDNERLEFLGDAVLGLVVAEALFAAHPEWHEGELTRVRAQLVSRKHMAAVALEVGLSRHLRLSRGEERGGLRHKATVLSNTMEAVIGAIFLDAGLDPVRAFVHNHVMGRAAEQLAEELQSGAALGNYKSALQEYLQSARLGTPDYHVRSESGPDHRKRFLVEVRLKASVGTQSQALARGRGSTKKHAEQDAARQAMEQLKSGSITIGGAGQQAEEPTE